ncbi:hypothetical protein PENSUB_477 [Penicillium subrubescens]|uniref:Uncharacterized protein n=1 Tax=Penicillium subrubescens TaxID=1316194 RepID=A0A1Q5UN57_9EURO|nr:hypothetical protein PENSUB_477 [Penicillium subrubescens]
MTRYAPLTTDLEHVKATTEINPGDTFIVRFKNSARDHKTDIWIGVRLTDDFEDVPGLTNKAFSRWICISDFFVLGSKIPGIFTRKIEGRDYRKDIKIYRELVKIADKKPGMDFWRSMAKKELLEKGKRIKGLGLILPDGFEEITRGISIFSGGNREESDSNSEDEIDAAELEGEPPSKLQALTSSFSASRALAESSGQNMESPRSLTFPGENKQFQSLHAGKHEKVRGSRLGKRKSAPGTLPAQDSQTKMEKEPTEDINNALVDLQNTLFERTWTLSAMIEHILLEKESSQQLLAILRDVCTIEDPELGKLISFLNTSEFSPQLLKVSNARPSTCEEAEAFEIGDCLGIHRQFQLQGVTNSEELHEQIIQLGCLYYYARHLNMVDLVEKITFKLQAAWNSYPGLSQLEPMLGVTAMAFKDSHWTDHLQGWLIKFIADTQDLIYYQCPQRFWEIMRDRNDLYSSVTQMRSEFNRKNPERYANPRDQIRQRGIDDF